MAKYKVIALNVTGVNGQVHYNKEVLTDGQLGADTVGIILKAGTELTNFDNQ